MEASDYGDHAISPMIAAHSLHTEGNMTYYAHSKDGSPQSEWQTIRSHAENVASLCEAFTAAWCGPGFAYNIGLLHDIGKYQSDFQRRICGDKHIQIEHAVCGAIECQKLDMGIAAYCIAGHHGGLPDCGTPVDRADERTLFGKLKRTTQDYSAYRNELTLKKAERFPLKIALAADRAAQMKQIAFWLRMVFSALVDADYLDTERFCTGARPQSSALLPDERLAAIEKKLRSFRGDNAVARARADLQDQCMHHCEDPADLFLMNMPTGSGKTLASMRFALEIAKRHKLQRIIYVIPYTSIIEQNAAVFRGIFGEDVVLEHHCNFDYGAVEDADTATKLTSAAENWDIPIVVTTNVQFFQSVYGSKPSRLRKLHNIAGSMLVFDEVHMFPSAFYLPCLEAVKLFVRDYGCKALFLTATMPSFETWLAQFGCGDVKTCDLIRDRSDFAAFERCSVDDLSEISTEALIALAESGAPSLLVVNTRKTARTIYQKLTCECYHLSTYMTKRDRARVLQDVQAALKAGRKFVLVSTSLIEAGVDLDFATAFRERAGLDNILQTAGRCNRNGKRAKETCHTYVFDFADEALRTKDKQMQVRRSICREVMSQYGTAPEAVQSYFDRLYAYYREEMSAFDFAKYITARGFNFDSYAQDFRLIDDESFGVIVCRNAGEEAAALGLLHQGGRAAKRKLQSYAVNVKQYELEKLLAQGAVTCRDGSYFLTNPAFYDPDTGIKLFDDTNYIC